MPEMVSISSDELQKLRERAKRLALEKSYLQLVYDLIAKLSGTPGLEDMAESIARLVCDTIGGSNVSVYYEVDNRFQCVDAFGHKREMDAIDDEMAREAFETGHPVDKAHGFRDTKMLTPEFTEACTWSTPLIVGKETLGVLKIEDSIMSTRDAREQFDAFFGYAALALKNEIYSYTRLSQAYDELNATNVHLTEEIGRRTEMEKELRKSKTELEAKVLERTRAIRTLSESNQTLMHATDKEQLLHDVCAVAVETGGYRMAWVGFVEHDEERSVRPVAWAGADADYLEHIKVSWGTGPTGQGPAGRSIRERKPVVARDIQRDPKFAPWRAEAILRGYRSSISLPLFDSKGTVFGALGIYADKPDAFDAEETELLSELAGDLAYGIEALRERQKRGEAEERLREAAHYARSLIEASLDPLVTISPEGSITDVNEATEEAVGIRRDRLIGTDFADCFTEPDRARAGYERVLERGVVRDYPLALQNVSGSVMDVEYNAAVYRNEVGELQGVFAAARDVTETKKARMQAAWLAAIVASSESAIFSKGLDGTITSWNAAAEALFGYSAEEAIGRDVAVLLPAGREGESQELIDCVVRGDLVSSFETQRRRKDGSLLDISLALSPILDNAGDIVAVSAIGHDITKRRQAERELRQSEEKFATAFNASPNLMAITRMSDGTILEVNEGYSRLLGYTRAESIGKTTADLKIWADLADRAGLFRLLAETGQANDSETTFRRKDSTTVAVTVSARTFDLQGEACLLSVVRDITERKRVEEAIRKNEAQLREAQRVGHFGSFDWDARTDTIVWSDEYYRIYGLDPKREPPGYEEHLKLYSSESAARLDAAVKGSMETGEPYVLDLEQVRPDGTRKWITARGEVKHDANNKIIGLRGTAHDITERKRAEMEILRVGRALRGAAARLNEAQRIARIGSWELDIVSNVLVWSDETYRIFEINPTEFAASYEAFLDAIHPEDREAVDSAYTNSVKTRAPYTIDHRLLFPGGRIKYVHEECETTYDNQGNPIRSVGTIQDVTERKRGEEALRASQRKLAFHLEQTLLAVIEWDTGFRVKEWNPAAEAIFGYSRNEAMGRQAAELILAEANRPEIESVWKNLLQQKGGGFNTNENVTKDGRTILCEWVNTPLFDDRGTAVGVMSLARDITERRQTEQLRVAKEAAEAAGAAKAAFLANMSHEIRTPMNAILGFSQLMRHDQGLSERQRQQLDIINSSGEHLLALINDVLEMSKIEAGRISANLTAFNLHSLLDEMDSLFGLRAKAKGLELRVIRSEEVPRFVVTDANKLRQVFINLLDNAVKFTEKGNVELRVTVRRDEEGKLRLLAEVEDTGRGIAPEDMNGLFQHFEQAAAGREMETGTGLGLAISREFVHLLGGEITVDSQVGVGGVFRFDVVIEEAEAEAVTSSPEERRAAGLCPGEPRYRVLVADDAPDNRELLVQLLEPVGFSVRSASDGKKALEEFHAWHPQLILMDMRMPVMDGYEATRRIRATPDGGDVAIIGVTASAFSEMRQGVLDAGVDEFLAKPFHEGELFDKIGKLLGARYVYEEPAEKIEQEAAGTLDAAAMAALPSDLVIRLRQATTNADFDAVLELVDEVGCHDDRSATALRTLAERFDSERILAALPGGEDS